MLFKIPDILLSVTAISNLGLLWFVYQKDRSATNKLFSLFVAFITFWAVVILLFRLVDYVPVALYLMKLSYISALLLAYFFYRFSLLFPKPVVTRPEHGAFINGAVIAVAGYVLIPGVLTQRIVFHDWGKEVILDPMAYWIFAIAFLAFFLVGQARLLIKIPAFRGLERMQLSITAITVIIVGAFGIYYNLFLPSPMRHDFQYIWSGPVFTFVFAIILTYSIFRFKIFNPKAILAELLVYVLILFLFVRLLLSNDGQEVAINSTVLVAVTGVGALLIRGVTREVELREQLEVANAGQTNLIHIINHQIKGYLAKSRNIFAELLGDASYGPISDATKPMLEEGLKSLTEGVDFVQQVLNSSSAEKGTLSYVMAPVDFRKIVEEASEQQKKNAAEKNLEFELKIDDADYKTTGDFVQLKEAVRNLINNSVIYTESGKVSVHLSHPEDKFLMAVTDTGIGLSEEDKQKLFTKGGRGKDSLKFNVNSTGYGLSFVKAVVEAHKGRVWADSAGRGKGSTFSMELPVT